MKETNEVFYHICGFIYYYLDIKVINDSMNFSNQLLSVISTFNLSYYQTSCITIELNKRISSNRIKILMKKKISRNSRMIRIFSIVWKLEVKCIGINRKNRVHQWLSLKTHFNPNHCQSIKMDIWSKRFEVVEQIDRVSGIVRIQSDLESRSKSLERRFRTAQRRASCGTMARVVEQNS